MHSLRHLYYQNKEKIWKVILIIAFVLGIIYLLNLYEIKKSSKGELTSNENLNYYNESSKTHISEKTAISGESLTEKEVTKINNIISRFLKYCQNGQAEEAYNMLSQDCKKNRYSTLEKFKDQYIQVKFNKQQIYTVQKWEYNTYKIDICEDIMATGNINSNEKITEYITIEEQEGVEKLNINGYIGKKIINKEEIKNDVKIKVTENHTYMEYEQYNFEIENLSSKVIKIDSLNNTGTIYLKDSSGNKYKARMHEILDEETIINPKQRFNLSIKFTNTYSYIRDITSITFENLILDYNKYYKLENKDDFQDICKFVIIL